MVFLFQHDLQPWIQLTDSSKKNDPRLVQKVGGLLLGYRIHGLFVSHLAMGRSDPDLAGAVGAQIETLEDDDETGGF